MKYRRFPYNTVTFFAMMLFVCTVRYVAADPLPLPNSATVVPTPMPVNSLAPSPNPTGSSQPAPTRRALPAPLDPIFPSADFLGPTIGVPTDRGIRTYGWFDVGGEVSTSKQSNFPLTYLVVPNRPELDQLIFRVERQPDTVQTKHFDWGFRLSNLYGTDYRWTTMEGVLSNQLLQRNQVNGYDPVEAYAMLYYPHIAQGMLVQVGRYISPPDIEAQLAPNNYLYSHSLMFDFDCYTQMGILTSTKLSDYWTLIAGIHSGNDIALWDGSAHVPTYEIFGRWVSHSNKDSVIFGIDAINGGQFKAFNLGPNHWGHDNLQQSNFTWTHVFNPSFHNLLEGYYLYQFNGYQGGTISNAPFGLGSGGGPGVFIPGRSTAIGLVDYLEAKVSPKDFLTFRTDYINDPQGERSGFSTSYGSLTLGATHKFSSALMVRPELRVEKAFHAGITPYDNGTKGYQSTFGIDAIQNFGSP